MKSLSHYRLELFSVILQKIILQGHKIEKGCSILQVRLYNN
jgi:hypothetical protein